MVWNKAQMGASPGLVLEHVRVLVKLPGYATQSLCIPAVSQTYPGTTSLIGYIVPHLTVWAV